MLNGAGVNLEEFSFVEYPSQSEVTKFLFMGRIMAEKGVNELLMRAINFTKTDINLILMCLVAMKTIKKLLIIISMKVG